MRMCGLDDRACASGAGGPITCLLAMRACGHAWHAGAAMRWSYRNSTQQSRHRQSR